MLRSFLTPRKIARHLFVLAIVSGCVIAGLWQLSRLHWQRGFDARVSVRLRAVAVPLDQLLPFGAQPNPDALTYRHVTATGTYDPSREMIVLARTRGDQNGNHVLTPMVLADGRAILVDRGWVPFELQVPPVAQARPPVEAVQLSGVLFPSEVQSPPGSSPAGAAFTKIDLARIGRRLPYPLEPVYLWLQGQAPAQTSSLPEAAPIPDLTASPPHLSYTIQWFVFATIGVIGYPIVIRREIRRVRAVG